MANSKRKWIWIVLLLGGLVMGSIVFMVFDGASVARRQLAVARTQAQVAVLRSATTNYFGVFGRWPATMTDLVVNSSNIVFISPAPPWNDGWGRLIAYTPPSATSPTGYVLSFGADGLPGGLDANVDIQVEIP